MSAAAETWGAVYVGARGAQELHVSIILVDAKRASGGVVSGFYGGQALHVALPQLCVAAVRGLAQIGGQVDEGAREDEEEV